MRQDKRPSADPIIVQRTNQNINFVNANGLMNRIYYHHICRIHKCHKRKLLVFLNEWNPRQNCDYFGESYPDMVVPSEKNTDIIDLSMEQAEFKDCALNTLSDIGEKDPTTSEKLVERDKTSKVENADAAEAAAVNFLNHIPTASIFSPVISHSSFNSEAGIKKSESILSLEKKIQDDELKVLSDAKSHKDHCEEISTNDSIRELEAESIDVKAFDSTLYETIETANDFLEESGDVFEHIDVEEDEEEDEEGFHSPHNTLGGQVEDFSRTPPRLAPPRSPLLTSTPHSLPQLPRVRASTSPAPSPLPPVSLVDSGPLSLPTIPCSGSKSYDYLLKVLLVGDSDVGKQEILSGLEDGSVDSPYCSSTGAGEYVVYFISQHS